jgi:hypothetical protein
MRPGRIERRYAPLVIESEVELQAKAERYRGRARTAEAAGRVRDPR